MNDVIQLMDEMRRDLRKDTCKDIVEFMLANRASIRECSKHLNIPKSTVHRYIHTYIKADFDEEYSELCMLLKYNRKHKCTPKTKIKHSVQV